MIGKYVFPLLAIIGLACAIGKVIADNQAAPVVPPAVQSPKVPFARYVAGAGMIEASTENIAIGTPVSGIVTAIYINLGDRVTPS
jgi:HlyD family secretion protein